MPAALSPPGLGPSRIGRFYQPPRNTVLPSPSLIIPVGVDGHVDPVAQGTAVTSALPTDIIDGDLVFIEVSHGSGGPPGTTITTPAGWKLLSNLDDGSVKLPTFWRFFITGDAAPSFTLGTSRSWCTRSTAFRYVDPQHPFGPYDMGWQQTAQPSSATYTSGTITPLDAGAMLVVCWGGKIAAGATQTITIPTGWNQTAPISQCTIPATVSTWAHFQYKPLGASVAINEIVIIGNSAVGQGTIIALRPLGSTTPIAYGATGTALHPGQGPSRVARFWQPARSTDIIAAGGPSATGAAIGEQHTDDTSAGVKATAGAAQSGTRTSGVSAGIKGAAGASSGQQRTADVAAIRKQAVGSQIGEQRTNGVAVKGTPPAAPAVGMQRVSGTTAGTKATTATTTSGQLRAAGITVAVRAAVGVATGQLHSAAAAAGTKAARGALIGQQHSSGVHIVAAPVMPGHGIARVGSTAGTAIPGVSAGTATAGISGGTATVSGAIGTVYVNDTGGEVTVG